MHINTETIPNSLYSWGLYLWYNLSKNLDSRFGASRTIIMLIDTVPPLDTKQFQDFKSTVSRRTRRHTDGRTHIWYETNLISLSEPHKYQVQC